MHHFSKGTKLISWFLKKRNIEELFCYFNLDKLIYFLNSKISLPIGNLSTYLLKLRFTHFGIFGWYGTVQNLLFSGFKCLKIVAAFGTLPLDPTRGIKLSKLHTVSYGSQLHPECPSGVGQVMTCLQYFSQFF